MLFPFMHGNIILSAQTRCVLGSYRFVIPAILCLPNEAWFMLTFTFQAYSLLFYFLALKCSGSLSFLSG